MSAIVGETLTFGQKNGPDLQLRVFGDEYYARYENLDGYTVLYDLDRGYYCYAQVIEGRFSSTGVPVDRRPPTGIVRHLRESSAIRNIGFKTRWDLLHPQEVEPHTNFMRTLGDQSGLLPGRKVSFGQVRGLTILVEFEDVRAEISSDDVHALLNANDYRQHGNLCSVRDYYRRMSAGKLDFQNRVVGPIRLPRQQSYYINQLMVQEALERAIDTYRLDLSEFDSRGEGIIDALSFMYAGRTLYHGNLWPHNSVYRVRHNGYSSHFYTIQSLGRRAVDLSVGTFCHEAGHMLCRFPDLYDYGERDGDFEKSAGLGEYCLMSSGNHLGGGKRPAAISAYLRELAQWPGEEVLLQDGREYEIRHDDFDRIYKHRTSVAHEYFLLENRGGEYEPDLPDAGLAVLHCDRRGSNEWQEGSRSRHFQCALIQADGRADLERNSNRGDAGDLFAGRDGLVLSHDTAPSSRDWSGADSGLRLSNIGPAGPTLRVRVGEPKPELTTTFIQEIHADQLIPDDNDRGIESTINAAMAATVKALRVWVDITHSYRGDLEVLLTAPDGLKQVLHRAAGGPLDNLNLDLHSTRDESLLAFVGRPLQGAWTLTVRDRVKDDVGRLDRWGIEVQYEGPKPPIVLEGRRSLAIPDNQQRFVHRSLHCQQPGKLREVRVYTEIEHSYIGDIHLQLVSPDGTRIVLREADGRPGASIAWSFTPENCPALATLAGQSIEGEWKLELRDVIANDTGKLNLWSLELYPE